MIILKHEPDAARIRTFRTVEPLGKTAVTGKAGDNKLSADILLVSVGRLPYTKNLALENAGLLHWQNRSSQLFHLNEWYADKA